ncbi:hypothetical protein, conserved [Eimeria tenella]|uniref:SCP domain-containing protein n=1 Tax=Eimeria tenella TaxID=5802 RepID=U6L8N1_EIMTE|nr:hypothetical protein, conserved [Eimeria tenella]CDJ45558.1 hypothetical protein, conserved [Eimeria tenella]|eukprot:XP_013236304.1 hypothetical protein, conserved [Eimeria tenella]
METNWSSCSTSCGHGKRMKLTRARKGASSCLTLAKTEICLSSLGCKSGEEFFSAIEGEAPGLPEGSKEDLGRRIMKTISILHTGTKSCFIYDTGLTQRAYGTEGLVGAFGAGLQLRIVQKFDPKKGSCEGKLESQGVVRQERMTMDKFREVMLEGHNAVRRQHSLPGLKWNDLLAANMLKYLQHQNLLQECRMEHSPHEARELPNMKQGIGENLWTGCTVGPLPTDIPSSWASEAGCYRFGKVGNPCTGVMGPKCSTEFHAHGLMTGHYTAVAWQHSQQFGCAYVVCSRSCSGGRPLLLAGCQYNPSEPQLHAAPSGNIIGQRPFELSVAKKMHAIYPQLLPEAPENPEQLQQCERFRREMELKNPKVHLAEKEQQKKQQQQAASK